MVVSLKANKKRIIAFVLLAAIVVGACFFLNGNKQEEEKIISGGTNEERVAFLQGFGWEIEIEPAETREVMIPAEFNDVYTAYNVMQKAQSFDLKPYAGKVCTQYKYQVTNYPDEPEVYATLLVCEGRIVGGDLACAEVDGFMHGFARDSARYGETSGDASSQVTSSMPEGLASSAASELNSEISSELSSEALREESSMESSVESTAGDLVDEDAYPTD